MTKIFAHRGASGYAPENTIEAFVLAMEQGADGIELDVHLTRDGEVVVTHDETIDRVSNGTGYVRDYTLEELRMFHFNNHMKKFQKTQIPTLREVLEVVRPSGVEVNVELKTGIYWYPQLEEKVLAIVKEMKMQDRVIYSSFNHYSVQKIRELDAQAETAYLYSDVILDVEKYAVETGVDGLHPAVYHLKMADLMTRYEASGLKIRVWTVNQEADMKRFIGRRVEAVITNYPDVACRIRNSMAEYISE